MTTATARHILVSREDQCNELKTQIEAGADFAELAKQHSVVRPAKAAATWANSAPA